MVRRATSARPKQEDKRDSMPPPGSMQPQLSSDEIYSRVAEAAYYRALQRGLAPGLELDDWLHAEAEVHERLGVQTTNDWPFRPL